MADESLEQDPALRTWGERWTPAASLFDRTVDALRSRGLLRARRRRWVPVAWAAMLAGAFLAGFTLGDARNVAHRTASPSSPSPTPSQPKEAPMSHADRYALLLFESGEYRPAATSEAQKDRVREYGAWIRAKGENGRFVDGSKLADDGRWCRVRSGQVEVLDPVSDGVRGTLAGYFILGAANYDEAVDLARDCPHLRYGGTIEVRRIES